MQNARASRISAVVIACVSALAFVPVVLDHGGLISWFLAAVAYVAILALLWRQVVIVDVMRESFARHVESLERDQQGLERRLNESERVLAEAKREEAVRLLEFEKEKSKIAATLLEETSRADSNQRKVEEFEATVARLNRENAGMADQRADAISRRQSLQNQYFELEKTANEIRAIHLEKSEQQRRTLTELDQLQNDLKKIQTERESATADVARLKREVETLGMQHSNTGLRESKLKSQVAELEARVETSDRELRNLKANTALQEELASRRAEIGRLCEQIDDLTRQRDAAIERGALLEQEKSEVSAKLPELTAQLARTDSIIEQLQDECRQTRGEPRHEMARHFVWKINFFKEQEVVLNFVNDGAEVDLIEARTEPELRCEIPGNKRLERGAEGRIRVTSGQRLPGEFVLKVRYTIYPQEASLKIRPFDSAKIERI
ncbi:MAG TPA: hypothetical protein VH595_10855 [Verrucomicrobiae bacterium]|nr:hypothetical protein [Verrucomicrobiae bacterium]